MATRLPLLPGSFLGAALSSKANTGLTRPSSNLRSGRARASTRIPSRTLRRSLARSSAVCVFGIVSSRWPDVTHRRKNDSTSFRNVARICWSSRSCGVVSSAELTSRQPNCSLSFKDRLMISCRNATWGTRGPFDCAIQYAGDHIAPERVHAEPGRQGRIGRRQLLEEPTSSSISCGGHRPSRRQSDRLRS
jgi:hypothetical protein